MEEQQLHTVDPRTVLPVSSPFKFKMPTRLILPRYVVPRSPKRLRARYLTRFELLTFINMAIMRDNIFLLDGAYQVKAPGTAFPFEYRWRDGPQTFSMLEATLYALKHHVRKLEDPATDLCILIKIGNRISRMLSR